MPKFKLLTESKSNPKTAKGESEGYSTFILHLAPAKESGFNVCAHSTPACRQLCLNKSGHGAIFKPGVVDAEGEPTNAVQEARKRRTRAFFKNQDAFLADLVKDVDHAIKYASTHGQVAVFRLNGTSDLPWERFPVVRDGKQFENMFRAFPDVQFYDYTKYPYDARRHDLPNYHLTFSFAETVKNRAQAGIWYAHGHSLSVVFGRKKSEPLPKMFKGVPVYDADTHDLRFLDKRGIAGLHAKGNAWKRTRKNGFIN